MKQVDVYIDKAAERMAQQIDQEILENMIREMYVKKGWVSAPFTVKKFSWPFNPILNEVVAWIHINHTDEYRVLDNGEFWFKSEADLTAFILRWS